MTGGLSTLQVLGIQPPFLLTVGTRRLGSENRSCSSKLAARAARPNAVSTFIVVARVTRLFLHTHILRLAGWGTLDASSYIDSLLLEVP